MKKVACMLIVIFSLFTLVGCSGKTDALQKELTELQQTVADLQGQLTEQTQTVAAQAEKIAELEAQLAEKEEQIAAMQKELSPQGEICSLEEAYEKGLLTTAQLTEIAYLWNGARNTDGDYQAIRETIKPENLCAEKTEKAKSAYAKMKTEVLQEINNTYYPETPIVITEADVQVGGYYGTWGDCAVVFMFIEMANPDIVFIEDPIFRTLTIGGVEFVDYSILYVWYPIATQQQQIEELENFKKKIEFSEEIPCRVGFLERPNEQYHLFLMQDYYLASSKEDWETLLFLREELSQEELNAKYTEEFFTDKFLIVAYSQQVCYEFQPAEINLYKKYDYQADAFFYEIVIMQSKNAIIDGSSGVFTILEVEKEYYENIS
ncbi:MAG: hypothetical protein II368_04340, partial [Clostridia bacterium]|nr:hypothetical protein [Clostridia bacterium]